MLKLQDTLAKDDLLGFLCSSLFKQWRKKIGKIKADQKRQDKKKEKKHNRTHIFPKPVLPLSVLNLFLLQPSQR